MTRRRRRAQDSTPVDAHGATAEDAGGAEGTAVPEDGAEVAAGDVKPSRRQAREAARTAKKARKAEKKENRKARRTARAEKKARKAGRKAAKAEREAGKKARKAEGKTRKAEKKAHRADKDELRPPGRRERRRERRQVRKEQRRVRRAEGHRGGPHRLPVVLVVGGVLAFTGRAVADGAVDIDGYEATAGSGPAADPYHDGTDRTWYCAAGTAGAPADHHVVISNPSEQPAEGTLTLYGDSSGPDQDSRPAHTVRVPSGEQVEIRIADLDDPVVDASSQGAAPQQAVATPVGVVAELNHPVTVRHRVEGPNGEDEGPCADRSASTWHVPWGTTTRDATFELVLFNPFPNDVVIDARFSTDDGMREPVRWQGLAVPAGQAVVMDVGEDVTRREHVAVTVEARSGSLVVESLREADGSLGPVGLSLGRGYPEGVTGTTVAGGRVAEDDRELLAFHNPGHEAVDVTVQAVPVAASDGQRVPAPFDLVVREGRVSVLDLSAAERVDTARGYSIEIAADAPVVVERVVQEAGSAGE